jgi:hypothetical protein
MNLNQSPVIILFNTKYSPVPSGINAPQPHILKKRRQPLPFRSSLTAETKSGIKSKTPTLRQQAAKKPATPAQSQAFFLIL